MDCRALKGMLERHITPQYRHQTELKINTFQVELEKHPTWQKTAALMIQTGASATKQDSGITQMVDTRADFEIECTDKPPPHTLGALSCSLSLDVTDLICSRFAVET